MDASAHKGPAVGISEFDLGVWKGELQANETRITRLENSVEARFGKMEGKIDSIDMKLDSLVTNAEIRKGIAISNSKALSVIKWLVGVTLFVVSTYFGTHHFEIP